MRLGTYLHRDGWLDGALLRVIIVPSLNWVSRSTSIGHHRSEIHLCTSQIRSNRGQWPIPKQHLVHAIHAESCAWLFRKRVAKCPTLKRTKVNNDGINPTPSTNELAHLCRSHTPHYLGRHTRGWCKSFFVNATSSYRINTVQYHEKYWLTALLQSLLLCMLWNCGILLRLLSSLGEWDRRHRTEPVSTQYSTVIYSTVERRAALKTASR